FSETFRKPALGGAIFGAGAKTEPGRRAVCFYARKKLPHLRGRVGSPNLSRHSQIPVNLMLNRTAPLVFIHHLVQQPAATVSRKADAARDPGEPNFESGPDGIREENGDIERRAPPDRV